MAQQSDAPRRVCVVGAGAWGTTVASRLAGRATTTLWAREPEVVADINEHHRNEAFLPGGQLDSHLRATGDLAEALDGAQAVLFAVPSPHVRRVAEAAAPAIAADAPVLSLAKGMEQGTLLRASQVLGEVLTGHDPARIGVLSGPNIAREVHAGQPSATVIAQPDLDAARSLQSLLMDGRLRVYVNPDVTGCEVGGVVKNVVALAAGMAVGVGFGENTLAALVTRGLAELTRLGIALGGTPLTFLGLSGIGDLSVTCHSPDSRNHHVGVELGRGRALDDVLAGMRSVAEGVRSAGPLLELAARVGVEMPICEQVAAVLDGRTTVPGAVEALMTREPGDELHGIG